jgi:hypothetical protein
MTYYPDPSWMKGDGMEYRQGNSDDEEEEADD